MKIGKLDIKPILLYLPDTPEWLQRWEDAKEHFTKEGFEDVYSLAGVHAEKWGIKGTHIYLLDGKPEENFYVGDGNVGNFISQYAAYLVMDALDYSHYMYLEDDCRMIEGWREKLEQALEDAGDDWDFMYVGSCCAMDKQATHVKGDVYEFPYRGEEKWNWYPMCTHSYIVNKRCIKHLIATNRDVANSTDISLIRYSFPTLRVLAILPRLAVQGKKTELTE